MYANEPPVRAMPAAVSIRPGIETATPSYRPANCRPTPSTASSRLSRQSMGEGVLPLSSRLPSAPIRAYLMKVPPMSNTRYCFMPLSSFPFRQSQPKRERPPSSAAMRAISSSLKVKSKRARFSSIRSRRVVLGITPTPF